MLNIKSKKSFFHSSIILIWVLSYLAILLLPFISSTIIYTQAEKAIKNSLYENGSRTLESIQLSFDKIISSLPNLVQTVQSHPTISELITLSDDSGEMQFAPFLFKLAKYLSSVKLFNENINDIYVYFPKLDIAVCSEYYDEAKAFYDKYYTDSNIAFEDWYASVNKYSYSEYTSVLSNQGASSFDIKYSVPLHGKNLSAVIVIRINESTLKNLINSLSTTQGKNIYIINGDNNILMKHETDTDYNINASKNNDYSVLSAESKVSNWKYIMLIPDKIISNELRYLHTLTYINYFVSIALGIFLISVFVKRNYRPINNILSNYQNVLFKSKPSNEYELIEGVLQDYISTKKRLTTVEHQNNIMRKSKFLVQLLTNSPDKFPVTQEDLQSLDIDFLSDYFCVVIFKYESLNKMYVEKIQDETAIFEENIENVMLEIISDIIKNLSHRTCKVFLLEITGQTVCLINYSNSNISSWQQDTAEILSQTKSILEKNFKFSFTASVSSIKSGLDNINSLYLEAAYTLRFRSMLHNSDVVFFKDINNDVENFGYSSIKESQLINFIKIGDIATATSILDGILEQIFDTGDIKYATISLFRIFNNIYDLINSPESDENKFDTTEINRCYYKFITCQNIDLHQELLHQLLKLACESESKKKVKPIEDKSVNTIVENIKNHIEQNYTNDSLNVASIGYYLDLTPSYVSNLFKKSEGITILDYISQYRIKEAKHLIEQSKFNITEIALNVGYTNVRTFMRAFVKLEGITPSQYKKLFKDKKN